MRSLSLLGLAATVSAGTVSVSLKSDKHNLNNFIKVTKRDGGVTLEAVNNITGGGYYSEFSIGTPPQKLNFHLDTGSSDTWVNSVNADLCRSPSMQADTGNYCSTQFNPRDSSTYKVVDRDGFNITYLDGTAISGDYFNDTVTIGDIKVENQQLGLALESSSGTGLMGLGFKLNVAADDVYPTILDNMVSQGLINTHAFSMYLNDLESDDGNILFGGIDSHKYIGDLKVLPIVPDSGAESDALPHYNVRLNDFSVQVPKGEDSVSTSLSGNATAILDSGSTLCIMPSSITRPVYREFGIVELPSLLMAFVDCAYAGDRGKDYKFNFEFDGKVIEVPLKEMVIDAFDDLQSVFRDDILVRRYFEDMEKVCMFGLSSASDFGIDDPNFVLLGDTFLRSAYVVYDQSNEEIGIAQANLRSTEQRITEFSRNGTRIPQVRGVEEQTAFGDDDSAAGHLTPSIIMTAVGMLAVAGLGLF